MIYKNGIKEYLLCGMFYGGLMGIFFGFSTRIFLLGVIFGVLGGFLFSFFMFVFIKHQEKKSNKKRSEIAKERKIICDGAATIQGNGGWMFLTEEALEFYPHKINFSTKEVKIPINMIASVKTRRNQLVIYLADQLMFTIIVCHNKDWKYQIETTLPTSLQKE